MNHKFTEKDGTIVRPKKLMTDVHMGYGMLWEEHQGRQRGAESMKEESRAGARLGAFTGVQFAGTRQTQDRTGLVGGLLLGAVYKWIPSARYGEGLQGISRKECVVCH